MLIWDSILPVKEQLFCNYLKLRIKIFYFIDRTMKDVPLPTPPPFEDFKLNYMDIKTIALQLKELGLRTLGASIWVKNGETPKFAGVTAEVKTTQFGAQLSLPTGENSEFIPVRLAKGVPVNKPTYDIYLYKAVRSWPSTDKEKAQFPNVTPIKAGDLTAFAH
jgi:hypothetical protein